MEGDKISRQEVAAILERSNTCAQSNSSLEEDYLKAREDYFDDYYLSRSGDHAL